jgi:hypothetical protein
LRTLYIKVRSWRTTWRLPQLGPKL